jgi:AAA family ATP:ADP antiporter
VNEPQQTKSPLDRVLNLFAPVQGGEGAIVLVMALNIFLLMTAYYIIKPVREALILSEWGPEAKIYASAGQAVLYLVLVPLYGRLADRLPVRRLITTVLVFFAACLVAFYGLAWTGLEIGIAFFLWVGIFNMMVVAQFWSFANDIYTEAQGKRLFAIIGFGMSAGAVFGGFVTSRLIEPLGLYQLLLLSAALLMLSLVLTWIAVARRAPRASDGTPTPAEPAMEEGGGFALVFRNRYLLLIGLLLILLNLVNTTGEYILGAIVTDGQEAAVAEVVRTAGMTDAQYAAALDAREDEVGRGIGRFYADFFAVVNLVGLLIQLFLVSRIVAWIGVRRAVMVLPLIAMGSYVLMALFPVLAVARWTKTAENATDYSLNNTVRNMLFLPTTRAEKYKAKQAVDTFFVRVGDVMAALLVLGGTTVLGLAPTGFALVNVGLAAVWLVIALMIGRRYRRLSSS